MTDLYSQLLVLDNRTQLHGHEVCDFRPQNQAREHVELEFETMKLLEIISHGRRLLQPVLERELRAVEFRETDDPVSSNLLIGIMVCHNSHAP